MQHWAIVAALACGLVAVLVDAGSANPRTLPIACARHLTPQSQTILVAGESERPKGQSSTRPPVGGAESLPDAMVFYVARGPLGCSENCVEWLAAEGTVHWDTLKRLIAALDRLDGRKLPILLRVSGRSNLRVAMTMGRMIRNRGFDVGVGATLVRDCVGKDEASCITLMRTGGPLDADINIDTAHCDLACVLILAGGVRRTVARTAHVFVGGMEIRNRFGLNVDDARLDGLTVYFDEQFRLYLKQMGIDPTLADIVARDSQAKAITSLSRNELVRMRIVTPSAR